jgi:hypothetical protein
LECLFANLVENLDALTRCDTVVSHQNVCHLFGDFAMDLRYPYSYVPRFPSVRYAAVSFS